MSDQKKPSLEVIEKALAQNVPQTYVTGFHFAVTPTDTLIVFELNGNPTQVVNISHGLSMEFGAKLVDMMNKFKADTKFEHPTPAQISEALQKSRSPQKT